MNQISSPKHSWVTRLANPTIFLNYSAKLIPPFLALSFIIIAIGLYMGFQAGEDQKQGIMVYVMYIHVPFAWLSMVIWVLMSLSAIGTLVWRHPLADVSLKTAAPIGALFTFLAIVTGTIWGKPTWGTWWVFDARLTSVLIQLIMYLGVIALSRAFDDPSTSSRTVAILVLIGFVNIPIIKFSVNWWNTLHQPASVFRQGGASLDASFLIPLLISAIGFTLLFFALHLMAMHNEISIRRIATMKRLAAQEKTL
jgi:heme exporter protein C